MIICDICKKEPWDEEDYPVYVSTGYKEFVCGCRLCASCKAVIEATMDELAGRAVSSQMRTENWGRKEVKQSAESN